METHSSTTTSNSSTKPAVVLLVGATLALAAIGTAWFSGQGSSQTPARAFDDRQVSPIGQSWRPANSISELAAATDDAIVATIVGYKEKAWLEPPTDEDPEPFNIVHDAIEIRVDEVLSGDNYLEGQTVAVLTPVLIEEMDGRPRHRVGVEWIRYLESGQEAAANGEEYQYLLFLHEGPMVDSAFIAGPAGVARILPDGRVLDARTGPLANAISDDLTVTFVRSRLKN